MAHAVHIDAREAADDVLDFVRVDLVATDVDQRAATADEHGLSPNQPSPLLAGLATFTAFMICGAVPLVPFALGIEGRLEISAAATAVVFFIIGAMKAKWALSPWWRSGMETLVIGGIAAALAFAVGNAFRGVV